MFMIDKIEIAGKSMMEPVELPLEVIEPATKPTVKNRSDKVALVMEPVIELK